MIRRAVPSDTDKIMMLWLKESVAAHSFIPQSCWDTCANMVKTKLLPCAETFVFCDKHQIKGFVSLLDGNYIGALFVRTDCQKRRIGRKLLEYVRRRRPQISLRTYVQNERAIRFYRRCGFKIVAENIDNNTGAPEVLLIWSRGSMSGQHGRLPGDS